MRNCRVFSFARIIFSPRSKSSPVSFAAARNCILSIATFSGLSKPVLKSFAASESCIQVPLHGSSRLTNTNTKSCRSRFYSAGRRRITSASSFRFSRVKFVVDFARQPRRYSLAGSGAAPRVRKRKAGEASARSQRRILRRLHALLHTEGIGVHFRSEERRVGKECRS